ncbi:hypothetical protein NDU88_008455 [Pleurodeles waltl]|uniref:Adenomatous polyposis coli N-terminal dimerisation domain-containing protein n=1 Tax=Pleurodeles waltl TaxID=8319 RepID=A0AAV7NW03_PLEWA|nr:hypothetical protein NDU88_008414 [Pleurodeles waltl]KAJ1120281.1 hypothetical protein NDU88_008455 [Pleurodeles waltl]
MSSPPPTSVGEDLQQLLKEYHSEISELRSDNRQLRERLSSVEEDFLKKERESQLQDSMKTAASFIIFVAETS